MKRCILLSCPCPHVQSLSLMRLTAPLSIPPSESVSDALPAMSPPQGLRRLAFDRPPRRSKLRHRARSPTPSTSCCPPSWSFRALRRFIAAAATHVPAKLSPHSHAHWVYLPSFAASSGFRTPSTLLSATCLPALFHAGTVLGLPSFGGFLPDRSPSDLSASGVPLVVSPLARTRLRGCQHRSDTLPSLRVFSADDARSSLGRSPLRGLDLHGLASRFRKAPLLGFSGSRSPPPVPIAGLARLRPILVVLFRVS